ncbi:MAG: T9SS type A sorting domain-containing protein [Saprospiraceae bacterium]
MHWTGPNGFQSDDQDPAVLDIQPGQGGLYTVSASQYGCPAQQAAVTVQVVAEPNPAIVGPAEIQAGESATLIATGGTTYLWSTGETTASISVWPTETTEYEVTVSNGTDCSATASHTVQVLTVSAAHEAGTIAQIRLVPNPAVDAAVLTFESATAGDAQLLLTDARGRQCQRQFVPVASGQNQINIPLLNLPAGAYQLTLIRNGEVKTIRLMKRTAE